MYIQTANRHRLSLMLMLELERYSRLHQFYCCFKGGNNPKAGVVQVEEQDILQNRHSLGQQTRFCSHYIGRLHTQTCSTYLSSHAYNPAQSETFAAYGGSAQILTDMGR